MRTLRAAAGLALVGLIWTWPASAAVDLMPHRALYVLALESSSPSSGLVGARGAMALEWAETCEGWIIRQRIQLALRTSQGPVIETDTTFTSWESLDSRDYRFSTRTTRNGALDEELRGRAHLEAGDGAGRAHFSAPADVNMDLPAGALFPTEHSRRLIEAAAAGESWLNRIVFDGATADGAAEVNAVFGSRYPPEDGEGITAGRTSWGMRLAFFDLDTSTAEPHYELSVRLYDNGVADDLKMDYGDFVLDARLEKIEALARPDC